MNQKDKSCVRKTLTLFERVAGEAVSLREEPNSSQNKNMNQRISSDY